jgi:hypothetical protein
MLLKCSWAQRIYNTLESIIWFSDSPGSQLLLWFQSCILHITPIPIQSKDSHASFSGLHSANKIGRQTNTAAMHILQSCIVETNLVEKNRLHTQSSYNRLSCTDKFGGWWRHQTCLINLIALIPSIASMHPQAKPPHKTYQEDQHHHMIGSHCKKNFRRACISGSHYPLAQSNYQ